MAVFLFWNTNEKPVENEIAQLCKENEIDVVILAEAKIDGANLLRRLNTNGSTGYHFPSIRDEPGRHPKLTFFHRYPDGCLRSVKDSLSDVSIRHFRPPQGESFLVAAVHFPSKLYRSNADYISIAQDLRESIEEVEAISGHARTLIVGDLNMDPFEDGMVITKALHSVMDRNIAKKNVRLVDGKYYRYCYNPMWGLMGDLSPGPPGTYFYERAGHRRLWWHTFDQVLIRPELDDYFCLDDLRIINSIAGKSLLASNGAPNKEISDHLPIVFSIKNHL